MAKLRRGGTTLLVMLVPGLLVALGVWVAGRALGPGAGVLDADGVSRELSRTAYGKYQRLALCVQVVEGSDVDGRYVRERLREAAGAFAGLRVSPGSSLASFDFPPIVDLGCPKSPIRLTVGGASRRVARDSSDDAPPPSPYHVHVFLVSRTTRESFLQTFRYGWHASDPEEYALDGTSARGRIPVTLGLYTSIDEIGRASAAEAVLESLWPLERAAQAPSAAAGR